MQAMGKRTVRRNKVVWQDAVIAILFGTIIVAGILCVARTIWSGYHFLDDHELIRMEKSFSQGMSLHDLLRAWIKNDMNTDPKKIVDRISNLIHGDITRALENCRTDKPITSNRPI